jgi:hypothetical protein
VGTGLDFGESGPELCGECDCDPESIDMTSGVARCFADKVCFPLFASAPERLRRFEASSDCFFALTVIIRFTSS